MKLRPWQQQAHDRLSPLKRSILEACPAAGKSAFAGALAKTWRDSGQVDCVLGIAPSTAIKAGLAGTWDRMFGLSVQNHVVRASRSGHDLLNPPRNIDAIIITYHELVQSTTIEALHRWSSAGWNFGIMLDEIHHAADDLRWGGVVQNIAGDLAKRSLVMTGTPFRTDGQPISLMNYIRRGDQEMAAPDFKYTYRDGVNDGVVRPLTCRWIDGEVTVTTTNSRKQLADLTRQESKSAARECFRPNGPFMREMIENVAEDLARLRSRTEYHDAAALFVCQPGRSTDAAGEDNNARALARAIKDFTGEDPEIVIHADGDGPARIKRFRKGTRPFLVAINMVSEGVDIPRIRSVAFCRYTESEMLFRQIAGRAARCTIPDDPQPAQLYVPGFPVMRGYGQQLWDESQQGLRERETRPARDHGGEGTDDNGTPQVLCVDAEPLPGGGHMDHLEVEHEFIARGEHLTNAHVAFKHCNQVALGAMLKIDAQYTERRSHYGVSPETQRANTLDRLQRQITRLGNQVYDGDLSAARRAIFRQFRVNSIEDVQADWTENQIQDAITWVDDQTS